MYSPEALYQMTNLPLQSDDFESERIVVKETAKETI